MTPELMLSDVAKVYSSPIHVGAIGSHWRQFTFVDKDGKELLIVIARCDEIYLPVLNEDAP